MLEQVRRWYGFYVCGYVVMPEHVHLLISEPERGPLSLALQMLKQNVARQLRLPEEVRSGSLATMISMYGAKLSGWKSCATFIGTPLGGAWFSGLKIGNGAAFFITRLVLRAPWRSSRSGRRGKGRR
jgi:hypothetical protein